MENIEFEGLAFPSTEELLHSLTLLPFSYVQVLYGWSD